MFKILSSRTPFLKLINTVKFYSITMSKKSALVLLSEGSEEMEFVISVDVLRRAGVSFLVFKLLKLFYS